jgi:hypothetical protein
MLSSIFLVPVHARDYTYDVDITIHWGRRKVAKNIILEKQNERVRFSGDGISTATITLDATAVNTFNEKIYNRMVRKLGPGPYIAIMTSGALGEQTTYIYATKGNGEVHLKKFMQITFGLSGFKAPTNLELTINISPPP